GRSPASSSLEGSGVVPPSCARAPGPWGFPRYARLSRVLVLRPATAARTEGRFASSSKALFLPPGALTSRGAAEGSRQRQPLGDMGPRRSQGGDAMRVQFVARENGAERLVTEAEVHFEEGPLAGAKLVGFCLWKSPAGEVYVTFPSRAFGAGSERRYFDYLRSVDGALDVVKRVKAWILDEYRKETAAA